MLAIAAVYTAISKKVVGKSARDNPEGYCGWFWVFCSSKKFEKMAPEATDICLRVLKESDKSMFYSYSRQEECIDHIPYYLSGLSRATDNLSRNSCRLSTNNWSAQLGNFQNQGNFCLWNLKSRKRFLLESRILGLGTRNPTQGIWNLANDWNPKFKFRWQGIRSPVPKIQNLRLFWWWNWPALCFCLITVNSLLSPPLSNKPPVCSNPPFSEEER